MASVYPRGGKYWCRLKDESGKWTSKPTPYGLVDKRKAKRYADAAQAAIDARAAKGAPAGPLTVRAYADKWIPERRALEIDWKSDESNLRIHVLPVIGAMKVEDVQPRHVAELFQAIRAAGKLAPRTVRNIYSTLSALFRDARIAGLTESTPCVLDDRQLGAVVDKDSEWRAEAVYTRDEVERLISDERIPTDRRMLYALDFLAGLRHGESAALRWRHWDPEREPLGRLLVARSFNSHYARERGTKTLAERHVPVHPTLAAMLAEWKLAGWPAMIGRRPGSDDLIVPLPPADASRRRSRQGIEPFRDKNYSGKRFREVDLPALGLRHRRMHDARATFITLALDDGADPHIIETRVTHTRKSRSAFDGYNRGRQWELVCGEVAKLRISRKSRGAVVEFATPLATVVENASDYSLVEVEAPGVES